MVGNGRAIQPSGAAVKGPRRCSTEALARLNVGVEVECATDATHAVATLAKVVLRAKGPARSSV